MKIEDAISKYHWIQLGEDGVVEMFLDHHALSTFRQCEAAFELSMMANLRPSRKSWNLEFGIVFHKMIEDFYELKRKNEFDLTAWLAQAVTYWQQYQMEEQFSEHKMYKTLGGVFGFVTMMAQYSEHFANEVDRLRVIGIEITFGKKREVPLGAFTASPSLSFGAQHTTIRCYLTGRIDFLMDNGSAIGPLDHKTTAFFKGDPSSTYDPQEGMTGYVYAVNKIMQQEEFKPLLANRKVDRIWMNFAQVSPQDDPLKRFKRVPVFKTDWQLEEYRQRQLRTFHKIYDMLILGERPDWNTSVCANMFHSDCQFKNAHRQNTASAMLNILKTDFSIQAPWNPETVKD